MKSAKNGWQPKDRRDRKAMMRMEIFVRQDSCVLSRTCMKSILNLHHIFLRTQSDKNVQYFEMDRISDNGSHRQ